MAQKIIVPVFPAPGGGYSKFVTVPDYVPTVGFAVLDISLYAQPLTDPYVIDNWRQVIKKYKSAGMPLLGYVPTDDGTSVNNAPTRDGKPKKPNRSLAEIQAFVDQWYTTFAPEAPDGIFFDEGPALYRFTGYQTGLDTNPLSLHPDVKTFYRSLYNYVKAKAANATVLVNAAYYNEADAWLLTAPAADIAILWEASAANYLLPVGTPPAYPANPPAWWTADSTRVMHTISQCSSISDMCQVVGESKNRGAGYVYVFDGTTGAYDHLPPYWREQVAAVALRDDNDLYIRDWTESASAYDQGYELFTRVFWTTSDVWHRTGNVPGQFVNDQPISDDVITDASGNAAGYAFARLHRKPCGPTINVEVRFLRADFGIGTNFEFVGPDIASSSVSVTLNQGDFSAITSGLPWSVPSAYSNHICLAAEAIAPGDPLKGGSLNGQSSSVTASVVVGDNNKAQRNIGRKLVLVGGLVRPFYAVVHNGSLIRRDLVIRIAVPPESWPVIEAPRALIVQSDGEHLVAQLDEPQTVLRLEAMRPLENRWIGLAFTAPGVRVGQTLPITLDELESDQTVNGVTFAVNSVPPDLLMQDNLSSHAIQFRRMFEMYERPDAERQSLRALEVLREGELTGIAYRRFLAVTYGSVAELVANLVGSEGADPFGLRIAARELAAAVEADDEFRSTDAHADLLNRLDGLLTMLRKAAGDAADILQTVEWQAVLYSSIPSLRSLEFSSQVVEQSTAFAFAYRRNEIGNDDYPSFVHGLVDLYLQTAVTFREHGVDLSGAIADIERGERSLTRLQKAHLNLLLQLEDLQER